MLFQPLSFWSIFALHWKKMSWTFQVPISRSWLVGGSNPSEKYDRQMGNLPQVRLKIKNIWNHQLDDFFQVNSAVHQTKQPCFNENIHMEPRSCSCKKGLFHPFGGFLKWWYPTTMGFPTKNDHFGVFWGYHHLRKHPFRAEHLQFSIGFGGPKTSSK